MKLAAAVCHRAGRPPTKEPFPAGPRSPSLHFSERSFGNSVGVHVQTTSRDWRSTLLSSFLSAIAVCGGVLSIAQPSAHLPANRTVSRQWTTEPAVRSVPVDGLPEWARMPRDTPRLTAARPGDNAAESDADDDGDNDDAPGAALAPAPTTLTADSGRTPQTALHEIGRRLSPTSDGHSLRAPPQ